MEQKLDASLLARYLERLGLSHVTARCEDSLVALHRAHAAWIPFENFDLHASPPRPASLELRDIAAKLIDRRRGGCCYEQNLLFGAALATLGFSVRTLSARNLRSDPTVILPKTHMCLLAGLGNRTWLADVGFGALGLRDPLPFEIASEAQPGPDTYRMIRGRYAVHLQTLESDAWTDVYAFGEEPTPLADFEVFNHFIATHPASRFLRQPVAAVVEANARVSLVGPNLTKHGHEGKFVSAASSAEEYAQWLERYFHFHRSSAQAFASLFWPRFAAV